MRERERERERAALDEQLTRNAQASVSAESGNFTAAVQQYEQILATDPHNVQALAGLALALPHLNQNASATACATQAVALAPDYAPGLCALAMQHLKHNDLAAAEKYAAHAVLQKPLWPRAKPLLAAVRIAQNRMEEAKQLLAIARHEQPCAEAFAQSAVLAMRTDDLAQVIVFATTALQEKPYLSQLWLLLSSAYVRQKNIQSARNALESAVRVVQPEASIFAVLCELCRSLKEYDAARMWGEKALATDPDCIAALVNMGTLEQDMKQSDVAVALYTHALKIKPELAEVHNNLGVLLKEKGDWQGVLDAMESALQIKPEHPVFHANYLTALIKLGRLADAEAQLPALPASLQDTNTAQPEINRVRALLLQKKGLFVQAHELTTLTLQGTLNAGNLDFTLLNIWLSFILSTPEQQHSFPQAFNTLFPLHKKSTRYQGLLASYGMIWAWLKGDRNLIVNLEQATSGYHTLQDTEEDKAIRIFYVYIHNLVATAHATPSLYQNSDPLPILNVLGESHALSPCHAVFDWHGSRVRAVSRFVMGIKMHHLAQEEETVFRYHLKEQVQAMPAGHLLLTIGEIDCRPDEGIWTYARKTGKDATELLTTTVQGYLSRLETLLSSRQWASITVQGIPAPGYALVDKHDPGDIPAFLTLIKTANTLLHEGALKRGWAFLDVYSATASPEGTGNAVWHLDGRHLKPALYTAVHPQV